VGTPNFQKPTDVFLGIWIVPITPTRIIKSLLNIDQDKSDLIHTTSIQANGPAEQPPQAVCLQLITLWILFLLNSG
jgi:hypothetical protein